MVVPTEGDVAIAKRGGVRVFLDEHEHTLDGNYTTTIRLELLDEEGDIVRDAQGRPVAIADATVHAARGFNLLGGVEDGTNWDSFILDPIASSFLPGTVDAVIVPDAYSFRLIIATSSDSVLNEAGSAAERSLRELAESTGATFETLHGVSEGCPWPVACSPYERAVSDAWVVWNVTADGVGRAPMSIVPIAHFRLASPEFTSRLELVAP